MPLRRLQSKKYGYPRGAFDGLQHRGQYCHGRASYRFFTNVLSRKRFLSDDSCVLGVRTETARGTVTASRNK